MKTVKLPPGSAISVEYHKDRDATLEWYVDDKEPIVLTLEFTDISPKAFHIMTGVRVPLRVRIQYFARGSMNFAREWSRKLSGIFHRHT